jgi:hypothetical protein
LSAKEYAESMMMRVDEVHEDRLRALREIEKEKMRVAKVYNKKVKECSFHIGELVWKTILPPGARSNKFGKWFLSWEGPYKVIGIVSGNAYFVETIEGKAPPKALNGKYLKKYYPSV